jgi:hypothetical protein
MPCETCSTEVVVKKNEHGTLSYRCDECDAAPYARSGTGQHAAWSAKLGTAPQPAPHEDPKPAPKTGGHPLFG